MLEAGDVIYIPSRPSTVFVSGQVMQPGSFPYRSGASCGVDYLQQAGGYSSFADESETFLVLPDGTARKIEKSWLHLDNANSALPPGSVIVVPRDLTPLDIRQTIIDSDPDIEVSLRFPLLPWRYSQSNRRLRRLPRAC